MSTTAFDRPLYGYRFVEIQYGDTLQAIAVRELGDASRWHDLISLNSLVPPYITDDPAQAGPGVLLSGSLITVPAPKPVISSTTQADEVFGADVRLDQGRLATANGDFDIVSGRDNLRQALKNVIETDRGELLFHSGYGSKVRRLIGTVAGPTSALLAAQYAKAAVRADSRVQSVTNSTATASGDVVSVDVDVKPVTGAIVQISATT
jgi:phage baseplate assembly protein W